MNYVITTLLILSLTTLYAQQGIKGKVTWVNGNQMPGPEKTSSQAKNIRRGIYIYKAIKLSEATPNNGVFFNEIKSSHLIKTKSKKDGSFCVKLPPGEYSVFVKEPQGLFANTFDGRGCIQCVTVSKDVFTSLAIQVNYQASY